VRTEAAALALIGSMLVAPAAGAEMAVGTWLEQDTATGDWGGLRSRAKDAGITFEANYQTDLMTNPIGGEKHGFAYAGLLEAALAFDLETMLGLKGLEFFIAASWASGRDLSDKDIGNLFTVAQVFSGRSVRLDQMYFQQTLFDEALNLAVGRLSTADDFATSDLYGYYVSAAINTNPFSIPQNVASFSTDPVASWGVRAIVQPLGQLYVAAGVYNADPDIGDDGKNGVDFVLNPEDGILSVAEVGYRRNQAEGDAGPPGNFRIGAYYDSSDFDPVDDSGRRRDGNYGLYLLLDQMVYREGGAGSDQGLTPWAALTFAPIERVNTLPFFAAGGLLYQGLLPGRDDDVTAFGVYYGKFSDKLQDQNAETVIEANHRFQLAPWLYVTPDFQYVFRPNGSDDIDDAAVFGGEISIDF
jgi:porin